eukprot:CAMPEP_0177768086 /NCGR_PEP_ID=MMETSP0491_2-20121128/9519_1 /TAXON_ID=63592 /ORGANISM="Tetraselmis chuii, Strain PLY429" /LENGTH=673 /DNA_ID=CAMNT_0019284841 /DNA_START=39 /DNA_END=2060 /DNA_ORIENTATION=+
MGGVSSTTYTGDIEEFPFKSMPSPIFARGQPLSTTFSSRKRPSDSSRRRRRNHDTSATTQPKPPVVAATSVPKLHPLDSHQIDTKSPDSANDPNSARLTPRSLSSIPGARRNKLWNSAADGSISTSPPVRRPDNSDIEISCNASKISPDDNDTNDINGDKNYSISAVDGGANEKRSQLTPQHACGTSAESSGQTRAACRAAHIKLHFSETQGRETASESLQAPDLCIQRRCTAAEAGGALLGDMAPVQHAPFGDLIPWGDPSWYRGEFTPYYTASHVAWRARVREFVELEIIPNAHEWDENKAMPKEIFRKAAQVGLLACTVGVPWPTEYAGPGPDGFDYFHELILIDELSRCGSGGVVWGLFGGLSIGLPPIVNFASKAMRDRVVPECLSGNKVICLAISEPYAGSDVANLKCTAEKTPDGRHFIVNGEKKWITNGVFADYFTVAVRTGGKGAGGLSLLLIERGMEGITTQQMKCTGVWPSGTAYITFDDVKVPVENLIGAENNGFKFIMYNFNHERWSLICQASRFARVCLEESFKFASKRATFGKKLLEHPVIRWKIAEMARQVEATHAQLELLTLQMNAMSKREAMEQLGGPLALLKVQSTKVFEYCAREAAQIFGGSSYVRGGQGEKVERLYREVRAYAIPGGSEEIMLDLAVRQAMKSNSQGSRSKL